VQAGAFRTQADAEAQRAKLAMLGWEARVSERVSRTAARLPRARGPFAKRDDAEQLKESSTARAWSRPWCACSVERLCPRLNFFEASAHIPVT
jgi:hypothetical protein